jgi:hypothetical protein
MDFLMDIFRSEAKFCSHFWVFCAILTIRAFGVRQIEVNNTIVLKEGCFTEISAATLDRNQRRQSS